MQEVGMALRLILIASSCALISIAIFKDEQKAKSFYFILCLLNLFIFWKHVWWLVFISLGISILSGLSRLAVSERNSTAPISSFTNRQYYNAQPAIVQSPISDFEFVPAILHHGTKSLEAAIDILRHNRWKAFSLYPSGIWMGDFNTALGYMQNDGAVVEIAVNIPASLVVNYKDIASDSRYSSWLQQYTGDPRNAESAFVIEVMGKRLIKQYNVYIAPTPITGDESEYYQVEGLNPLRLLDRSGNQIRPHNGFRKEDSYV